MNEMLVFRPSERHVGKVEKCRYCQRYADYKIVVNDAVLYICNPCLWRQPAPQTGEPEPTIKL